MFSFPILVLSGIVCPSARLGVCCTFHIDDFRESVICILDPLELMTPQSAVKAYLFGHSETTPLFARLAMH